MRKPRCRNSDMSMNLCKQVCLFLLLESSLPLLNLCGAVFGVHWLIGPTGLIRAPATQQFRTMDPSTRKLPLQPKESNRNWLRGARVNRTTGLPVMARPFASGRLTWKYVPMMVRDGCRLKARPKPVEMIKPFVWIELCRNNKTEINLITRLFTLHYIHWTLLFMKWPGHIPEPAQQGLIDSSKAMIDCNCFRCFLTLYGFIF